MKVYKHKVSGIEVSWSNADAKVDVESSAEWEKIRDDRIISIKDQQDKIQWFQPAPGWFEDSVTRENSRYSIHSFRYLVETIAVGNRVVTFNASSTVVNQIRLNKDKSYQILCTNGHIYTPQNIKVLKPSMTTEDGVQVYEEDVVFFVGNAATYQGIEATYVKNISPQVRVKHPNGVYFFTKNLASDYAVKNMTRLVTTTNEVKKVNDSYWYIADGKVMMDYVHAVEYSKDMKYYSSFNLAAADLTVKRRILVELVLNLTMPASVTDAASLIEDTFRSVPQNDIFKISKVKAITLHEEQPSAMQGMSVQENVSSGMVRSVHPSDSCQLGTARSTIPVS